MLDSLIVKLLQQTFMPNNAPKYVWRPKKNCSDTLLQCYYFNISVFHALRHFLNSNFSIKVLQRTLKIPQSRLRQDISNQLYTDFCLCGAVPLQHFVIVSL